MVVRKCGSPGSSMQRDDLGGHNRVSFYPPEIAYGSKVVWVGVWMERYIVMVERHLPVPYCH